MIKTLATLAILAASACSAYTNTVLVSTNTRAATEKWVSVRFEATLPSTPTNPASKYLNGNREWSSISLGHPQLSDINGDVNYQHITTGQVAKLDHISDNGVLRVRDTAQPSRYFMEVVNGTGTVFEVTGPFTNLMVTLSEDFGAFINEEIGLVSPSWTSNDFPFIDGYWVGAYGTGTIQLRYDANGMAWSAIYPQSFPITLTGYGSGTATVSIASIYYSTNAFAHFTTEAELEAAKAACGVVLTNTVNAATNALMPYTRTVYGDLATTNEAGYAAFNTTNAAAASYSAIVPTSFIGSNTNTLRYRFNSLRKFGAVTNTAWFVKSGFGAGIKSVSTLVSVKDASGNVISQSSSQLVYLSDSSSPSSVTNVFTMPDNVYSGTLEVACMAVSTNASFSVRLYSGAQYTNLLTFSEAPTAYATYAELGTRGATNVTANGVSGTYDEPSRTLDISAIVMSNSVSSLVVWTNSTGAATNMAWRENGVWSTNAFGGGSALPSGTVTNGQPGPLTLGGVVSYVGNNVGVGTTTDNGVDKLQVNGSTVLGSNTLVTTASTGANTARKRYNGVPLALEIQFGGASDDYSYPMAFFNNNAAGGNYVFTSFAVNIAAAVAGDVMVENPKGGMLNFCNGDQRCTVGTAWAGTPVWTAKKASQNMLIGTTTDNGTDKLQVNGAVKATSVKSVYKTSNGTSAVANGTYTVGIGTTKNGTITITDGIITAIQQAQ